MRILLLLLSLGAAFGALKLSCQTPVEKPRSSEAETLEGQGLYPVLVYEGRPLPAADIVKPKERWEGLLPNEEVVWLPKWDRYKGRRGNRLLLVVDGDDTVYLATSQDGFEPVGYIKKKGLMKRTAAILKSALLHGLEDGPLHILLSVFGF